MTCPKARRTLKVRENGSENRDGERFRDQIAAQALRGYHDSNGSIA